MRGGTVNRVVGLRLPLVLGPGLWYEGVAAATDRDCSAQPTARSPASLVFHDHCVDLMHVT